MFGMTEGELRDYGSDSVTVTDETLERIRNERHQRGKAIAELVLHNLPTVRADRRQMNQLLTNLISNAIKFRSDVPSRVEVSAVTCGGELVFTVKDNGIGIDPKYSDKLFKMFSRLHTREEYPGIVIDLEAAKKIVGRYGGKIWFESEPGEGTKFFFTIPA